MYIIDIQSDDEEDGDEKKSAVQMLLFSATMVRLSVTLKITSPDLPRRN